MGGYKQSGIGRELGKEGLEEYLVSKHILTILIQNQWIGSVNNNTLLIYSK